MKFILYSILSLFSTLVYCQNISKTEIKRSFLEPSESFNKNRTIAVSATAAGLYGGSLILLNEYWYKNYPRSGFHTFDDSDEWMGIDKIGHAYTAYFQGAMGYQLFSWAGVDHTKATLIGGSLGFLNQTIIEVLDGHSDQWGWSNYDLLANTSGTALFISQNLIWKEQRILMKFGYSPVNYEKEYDNDPQILAAVNKWFGESGLERSVKDYNAQTYWLSVNPASFMKNNKKFPEWLNIALGTGAEQMFHSTDNSNQGISFEPYRQFYLSADIDFSKIKTNSAFLRTALKVLNIFKMPFPALVYDKNNKIGFKAIAF